MSRSRKFESTPDEPYPQPSRIVASIAKIIVHTATPFLQETIRKIQTSSPLWPLYATFESRLTSYTSLPWSLQLNNQHTPEKLAEAGFLNLGYRNIVQCFYCSGCIGNWEIHKLHPLAAHAAWHPQCQFLRRTLTESTISFYRREILKDYKNLTVPPIAFPLGFSDILEACVYLDEHLGR